MTTLEALETSFLDNVSLCPDAMEWQHKAWALFLDKGLPDRSQEAYRYVRLSRLYEMKYQEEQICQVSFLPTPALVLPLKEAYKSFRAYLDKQFAVWLDLEQDPLALLCGALAQYGLFIYVPPGVVIEAPWLMQQPSQLVVYLGKGAALKLRLTRQEHAQGSWTHRKMDIYLDEDARLEIQVEPNLSDGAKLDVVRAHLKQGSYFRSLALPCQGVFTWQDYHVRLIGSGSEAQLAGLLQGEGTGSHHVRVLMEHIAPHTISRQQFKAVLGGELKQSFDGKIYIHPQAQKVDAYQRHNALILSPLAESKSKPNLEIFADDVKASHGCTCGQIKEEDVFYLTSRGIPLAESRSLLIDAFCHEVLDARFAT